MDLTLDYNIELFPLQSGQSFALALASSLSRAPQGPSGAEDEDKDRDVWRPDAKGRKGLDDDYEYVMYGKVSILPVFTCTSRLRNPAHLLLRRSVSRYICMLAGSCGSEGVQVRRRFSRDRVSPGQPSSRSRCAHPLSRSSPERPTRRLVASSCPSRARSDI